MSVWSGLAVSLRFPDGFTAASTVPAEVLRAAKTLTDRAVANGMGVDEFRARMAKLPEDGQ